ncbi:LIC_12616 family protein [Paenibacillus glucanolyticus]|uniref:phage neck terminator protein n=1 Tax=Paenibacillus glucanolyticus TaxID=59843 RepID=UPI0035D53952
MLDYTAIRNPIVSGLYSKLQRPVIRSDGDGDVPEYPYITLSITSPYLSPYGGDSERFERISGITHSVKSEATKHVELVISFTVYSPDEDEALNLCMKLINHFNREERDNLRNAGIVVVSNTDVQNRSVVLVDHYERRLGVDFRFRVKDRYLSQVETIGTAIINSAEIKGEVI